MTNGAILLSENDSLFSPISQLNYEFYAEKEQLLSKLSGHEDVQCIIGDEHIPFGDSQHPKIDDYADATDTLQFLINL